MKTEVNKVENRPGCMSPSDGMMWSKQLPCKYKELVVVFVVFDPTTIVLEFFDMPE
jgi:NADH:ubiquinone oxidoreductase subunit 3 (subunit A)